MGKKFTGLYNITRTWIDRLLEAEQQATVRIDELTAQLAAAEVMIQGLRRDAVSRTPAGKCPHAAQLAAVTKDKDRWKEECLKNGDELLTATTENARLREHLDEARTESSEWGIKYIETVDHLTIKLAAVTAERDEARALATLCSPKSLGFAAENARLRAAIAPTAENCEAYRRRLWINAGLWPSAHDTGTFLDAIAARAGVKL